MLFDSDFIEVEMHSNLWNILGCCKASDLLNLCVTDPSEISDNDNNNSSKSALVAMRAGMCSII
jgi:hypothetical protein